RAALALKRDREAMRFVARLLEHAQRRRPARETKRFATADHEDFFLALREADDRQRAKAELLERGVGRAELPLAAVDDHEIGKRLLLVAPAREVARHDLVHRCEVVDALDRLHLELAILGAIGPAVLKPHA